MPNPFFRNIRLSRNNEWFYRNIYGVYQRIEWDLTQTITNSLDLILWSIQLHLKKNHEFRNVEYFLPEFKLKLRDYGSVATLPYKLLPTPALVKKNKLLNSNYTARIKRKALRKKNYKDQDLVRVPETRKQQRSMRSAHIFAQLGT